MGAPLRTVRVGAGRAPRCLIGEGGKLCYGENTSEVISCQLPYTKLNLRTMATCMISLETNSESLDLCS